MNGKCINGKCVQTCEDNNDCPYEDHCLDNFCLPKICQSNRDCPEGKKCIDDYCSIPRGNRMFVLLFILHSLTEITKLC